MNTTPRTDAADDVTMRYSARFERVRDLCRELEIRNTELLSALERTLSSYRSFLKGHPVRDISETFAEADAAIEKAKT